MRTGTVILLVAVLALVCLANSAEGAKKQKSSKVHKSSGGVKQERSAIKSKKSKSGNKYSKSANAKEEKLTEPKTKDQGKQAKEQKASKVKKVKRSAEEAVVEEKATKSETKCECPPVPECVCEKCAATQAAKPTAAVGEEENPDVVVIEEEEFPSCEATVGAGLFCEQSCSCKQGTVCFASSLDATQGICKIPEPEDLDMGVYL